MYCINCGSPVSPGDRFCTNCGADLHAQEVESTEPESPVGEQQDFAASTPDAPSSVSGSVVSAVAQAKPRRHGLVMGLSVASAVVLVIAVVLSLIATNVLPNPLVRERAVTFAIKAPHYNEKTDSKIPLHITGRTSSGRVISQHVYVSPKAPVVHLAPGQYTVQVEASPLLSSGDVYRIPEPIKIDTTKNARPIGESQPVVQKLKFEVKPANEVTEEDIARAEKFAKNTDQNPQTLKIVKSAFSRRKVAEAYNKILDTFSKDSSNDAQLSYSLHDINADGVPELLVNRLIPSEEWIQVNNAHALLSVWTVADAEFGVKQVEGTIPLYHGMGISGLDEGYYPDGHGIRSTQFDHYIDPAISDVYTISNLHIVSNKITGPVQSGSEEGATYLPLSDRDLLDYYAMKSDSPIKQYLPELSPEQVLRLSDASAHGQLPISGTVKRLTWKQVHDYSLTKIKGLSPWYETRENIDTSVVNQEEEWLQLDDPDFESLDQYRYPDDGTREWRKTRPYFHLLAWGRAEGNLSLSQYDGKHVILLSEGIYAPRNEWWLALPRIIVNSVITL